ncbi:MAG: hypothetical protein ACO28V_03895 [Chitinophagaceae bacterium]
MLKQIISDLEKLRNDFVSYEDEKARQEVISMTKKISAVQYDLHNALVKEILVNRHKVVNTLNLLLNSAELIKCQAKVIVKDLQSYKHTSIAKCFKDAETELNKIKQNETSSIEFRIIDSEEMDAQNWSVEQVREYINKLIGLRDSINDFNTRIRAQSAITKLTVYLNALHSRAK